MNFVAYYLNSSGYPAFCFVQGKDRKEAKEQFDTFHPNDKIQALYVDCNDVVFGLTHMF